jgi:uncharacterized RDD family membrane protein YckC
VSTSAVQATPSPAWKQEVNRRLAEHKGRKPAPPAGQPSPAEAASSASRRAQEAAARVAARYAKAPSYSEVLAAEALAALRAAEAAQQAALQANAAVQTMLAGFESAVAEQPAPSLLHFAPPPAHEPAPLEPIEDTTDFAPEPAGSATAFEAAALESHPVEFTALESVDREAASAGDDLYAQFHALRPAAADEPVTVRWAPEFPARSSEPAQFHTSRGKQLFEEEWWKKASAEPAAPSEELEMIEPAQPIVGNIIEFPRELVAPRKARPRLAEAPSAAAEPGAQLSIFEVDPALLPVEPQVEAAEPAQAWTAPAWSGIELDAQPEYAFETAVEEATPQTAPAPELHAAPFSRRFMAAFVDAALVSGGVLAAAIAALHNSRVVPSVHTAEIGLVAALLVGAALYFGLFFALAHSTPGMMYARIQLSTFEGDIPTRAQRCARLMAMVLSAVPLGLGIVWFLFDDENLCWHDRLSRTYLRQ